MRRFALMASALALLSACEQPAAVTLDPGQEVVVVPKGHARVAVTPGTKVIVVP